MDALSIRIITHEWACHYDVAFSQWCCVQSRTHNYSRLRGAGIILVLLGRSVPQTPSLLDGNECVWPFIFSKRVYQAGYVCVAHLDIPCVIEFFKIHTLVCHCPWYHSVHNSCRTRSTLHVNTNILHWLMVKSRRCICSQIAALEPILVYFCQRDVAWRCTCSIS